MGGWVATWMGTHPFNAEKYGPTMILGTCPLRFPSRKVTVFLLNSTQSKFALPSVDMDGSSHQTSEGLRHCDTGIWKETLANWCEMGFAHFSVPCCFATWASVSAKTPAGSTATWTAQLLSQGSTTEAQHSPGWSNNEPTPQ